MSAPILHRLANRVRTWAETAPEVRALFWYGGYGYGRLPARSDLDVAVLLRPEVEISQAAASLVAFLTAPGEPPLHRIIDPGDRRLTAWMGEAMTKLDVVFGRTAEHLAWLADADDVPEPRLTAAWPIHDPDVVDLLHRASRPLPLSNEQLRRERLEREVDKFLVAFEACSAAHAKRDAYACYFQHNLALGRLARIVQLTRAGHRHLYLPRDLLAGLLLPPEQESFRALVGTLQLSEAPGRKHALADAFLKAVEEARVSLAVRRDPAELSAFLESIQRRDLFPPEERG